MQRAQTIEANTICNAERTADATTARQLAAAVIYTAIVDVRRLAKRWQDDPTAKPLKHENSARAWIQNVASCAPFGFRWCCDVAGVDFSKAQALLLSWLRVAPQTETTRN